MLYDVGEYKEHRKYLKRCLDIIENMQKLETRNNVVSKNQIFWIQDEYFKILT